MLADDAYYSQPITLRHPIVFYDGHLPGFSFNTLVKRGLGRPSIDARLEQLFARGIDPHESQAGGGVNGVEATRAQWPSRGTVRQFAAEADRQVLDALAHGDIDVPGHPLLDRAEAAFSILEHEAMHQETLLYMWHRLPLDQKRRPAGYRPATTGAVPEQAWVQCRRAGRRSASTASGGPFAWDNERPAVTVDVPAFQIQRHDVTNDDFLAFVEAGGYADARWWHGDDFAWVQSTGLAHPTFWERGPDGAWLWRGMFDLVPLPPAWPVYVSHAEARAYAAWRGLRLPTEAEYQRAAYGSPDGERPYPWGDAPPTRRAACSTSRAGIPSRPGAIPPAPAPGASHDLVGNGWEWTGTVFAPFPGFAAMPSYPEYSADFFDGEHFVMKGASPATATALLRPTFRNWFRPRYPYVYATFRCVRAD